MRRRGLGAGWEEAALMVRVTTAWSLDPKGRWTSRNVVLLGSSVRQTSRRDEEETLFLSQVVRVGSETICVRENSIARAKPARPEGKRG